MQNKIITHLFNIINTFGTSFDHFYNIKQLPSSTGKQRLGLFGRIITPATPQSSSGGLGEEVAEEGNECSRDR